MFEVVPTGHSSTEPHFFFPPPFRFVHHQKRSDPPGGLPAATCHNPPEVSHTRTGIGTSTQPASVMRNPARKTRSGGVTALLFLLGVCLCVCYSGSLPPSPPFLPPSLLPPPLQPIFRAWLATSDGQKSYVELGLHPILLYVCLRTPLHGGEQAARRFRVIFQQRMEEIKCSNREQTTTAS